MIEYKDNGIGIIRLGNYLISKTDEGSYSLTSMYGQDLNKTWLEGEVICANHKDAERIALVFTAQDELTFGIRDMMKRRVEEQVKRNENI